MRSGHLLSSGTALLNEARRDTFSAIQLHQLLVAWSFFPGSRRAWALELVFEVALSSFHFLCLYRDLIAKIRELASRYWETNTTCTGTKHAYVGTRSPSCVNYPVNNFTA